MKKALVIFLTLLLVFSLVGCGSEKNNESGKKDEKGSVEEYVIGFQAALTGNNAQDGLSGLRAAQLAVDQVNAKGGINGVPVRLYPADDKGDPKEAATVGNMFGEDKDVLIMVGPALSSAALAIAPIIEKKELSCIAFSASSVALSGASDYFFRTIPTDEVGGRYLIEWLENNMSPERVGVIYENSDFGKGVRDVFVDQLKTDGVTIAEEQSFLPDETSDFTTALTALKNADIDLLVLGCSYNESALICKQALVVGLDVPIASIDACYNEALIELGGDAVEGMLFTAFFSVDKEDELTRSFVDEYEDAHGIVPNTFAAYAYDATLIAIDAIKASGADRAKINEYLKGVKDFKGVTGSNTFDEFGDVSDKEPLIMNVSDGVFSIVE